MIAGIAANNIAATAGISAIKSPSIKAVGTLDL